MNLSQNNKNHEINFMVKEKLHLCWVINGLRDTKKKIKCNKLVNYSKDNYTKRIKYLRKQLILYYLKNIFFLPIWIINIFKRNFLQDEPSVLSNIKVIFTKKEFRPLRAAIIFWTIFFIFLISGVVYIVKNSNITNAASFTWVQSDWSGNPDGGSVADHTNNRTGWTQYESVSNIYVSSTGQLSLTTSTYSLTDGPSFSTTGDDTGGDFDSGVNANTAVSSSSVRLAVSATSSVNIWNSTDLPFLLEAVSNDSQMIRNGADDTIYVLPGSVSTGFYSYSISSNTWTALATVPANVSIGSQMIRNGSDNEIYVLVGNNSNGFYKYLISSNTWTTLTVVPTTIYTGSQMIRNGASDTIYVLRGGLYNFYSYSISGNTWTTLNDIPGNVLGGAQMIRNGSDNEIYVLRGTTQASFYSYSISGNTWTTLAVVPGGVNYGAQMIRNGADDTIYVLRGSSETSFYSYSISGNTWTTLAVVPGTINSGSQMIRNGSDDTIYVLRGNNQTSFYSYSISGNTWTTLAVVPGTISSGSQMIRNGADDTIYVLRGNGSTGFYSYSISGNTWTGTIPSLLNVPEVAGIGSQMIRNSSNDDVYVLTGNTSNGFYKYLISSNTWITLSVVPGNIDYGSQMIRNGADDTIYVLQGNNVTGFYSYSISSNTWTTLSDAPGNIYYGSQMIRNSSDDAMYVLAAGTTNAFYSYSISSNTWTTLTVAPETVGIGAQMIRNGLTDDIYVLAAGTTNAFYSYSISSNTWTTLAVIPVASYGGQMIRNGSDNEIYVLVGNSSNGFYKYLISSNTWITLSVVPGNIDYGSQMIRNGADDTIYVLQGNDATGFYSYSISSNTWTIFNDTPFYIGYSSKMIHSESEDYIYVFPSNGTTDFYKYTINNTMYQSSGTFTSNAIDIGSNQYSNLTFTSSTPAGVGTNAVRLQVATNNDNSTWNYYGPDGTTGTYYTVTTTAINTTHNNSRYLKYKILLQTANTSSTPSISSVGIGYNSYDLTGTATSSVFNTGDLTSSMSSLAWTENLNTADNIQFQLKTSTTSAGLSTAAFVGPDGTSSSYFTDPAGGESMPSIFTDSNGNNFFQYQATLTSNSGATSPVLSSVSTAYSFFVATIDNAPGGGGHPPPPPTPPSGEGGEGGVLTGNFEVKINNNSASTNSNIVNLTLNGGPDAAKMAISNTSNFAGISQQNYVTQLNGWNLCFNLGVVCPQNNTIYNVYARFYTALGISSGTVSSSIIFASSTLPTQTTITTPQGSGAYEFCDNMLDDDIDGFVDCADSDCFENPVCTEPPPVKTPPVKLPPLLLFSTPPPVVPLPIEPPPEVPPPVELPPTEPPLTELPPIVSPPEEGNLSPY